jgi:hypothetical protein
VLSRSDELNALFQDLSWSINPSVTKLLASHQDSRSDELNALFQDPSWSINPSVIKLLASHQDSGVFDKVKCFRFSLNQLEQF